MIECSIDGCNDEIRTSMGYCNFHYRRFLAHGNPLGGGPRRFVKNEALNWLKSIVESPPPDQCVLWKYSINSSTGYGELAYNGKKISAHRLALILFTGIEPEGMHASHGHCHNRACINPHPDHGMRWATPSQNNQDKLRDGTIQRGEAGGRAILTERNVSEIAELKGHFTIDEIAAFYGVGREAISSIHTGRTWGWLTGVELKDRLNKYSDDLILEIVRLRNVENMTQKEIGDSLGLAQPYVSQILLGKRRSDLTGIIRR